MSTPPERSLWALSADAFDAEVEVAVEFQPYGIGPSSFGPSIVVLITAATVKTPRARAPELAGRNAILVLGSDPVASGGDYSGTVVTRKQGDRIMLVLKDVLRKSGS